MGTEILVTDSLTDRMIEAGRTILESMGDSGRVIEDAFWLQESDDRPWRLVLASPGVSYTGAKPIYAAIQGAISHIPADLWVVELEHISVVDTDHSIVCALRGGVLPFRPDPTGYRLSRVFVEHHYIHGAYLYRLTQTVGISCPVATSDPINAFVAWDHLDVFARNIDGVADGSVIAHGRTEIAPEGIVAHIDLPCRYGINSGDRVRCTMEIWGGTKWEDDPAKLHVAAVALEPI